MNPQHAIFLEASADSLGQIATALGRSPSPGADRGDLVALLTGTPGTHTEFMVRYLTLDELRAVCGACGLLRGGDVGALRNRIIQRSKFEPATSGRAPRTRPRKSAHPGLPWSYDGRPFVAIDFETADRGRDSACSIAVVRAEGNTIVETRTRLIRPPRSRFEFTHIHGLRWSDVQDEPTFQHVWPDLVDLLQGATFIAAHNAPFDRGVLETCCHKAGLVAPSLPYRCTVKLAKRTWRLPRARLPDVCAHLDIALKHHDATSDAEACAKIVLASPRS